MYISWSLWKLDVACDRVLANEIRMEAICVISMPTFLERAYF